MCHNFVNLFSRLSKNTVYKEIYIFQYNVQSKKYYISRFTRDSLTLLRTPVSAIFVFAPTIDNAAIEIRHCILG